MIYQSSTISKKVGILTNVLFEEPQGNDRQKRPKDVPEQKIGILKDAVGVASR
jgi:hypothetical protein